MLQKPKELEPFVKEIFVLYDDDIHTEKKLPFYADGFAGIIYSKSQNPFYLQPRNKQLPNFYLYGLTLKPISLDVKGSFKLIVMTLYPFAVRVLLGVNPKELNDDCYDLRQVKNIDTLEILNQLDSTNDIVEIVAILTRYFDELLKKASLNPDYRIKLAINIILKSEGLISIKEVREQVCITERTLERQFLKEVGITAKQFAKIIQFSNSVKQLTDKDYLNLTEIGYDNGFADQSHFIRSFKRYTGKTPKELQKQISM